MRWMICCVGAPGDRKSTRLNSSHLGISYAVFCLKKKNIRHLGMRIEKKEHDLRLIEDRFGGDRGERRLLAGRAAFIRRHHVAARTSFFFFNDAATTEIYTLSLHDALPI